MAVMVAGRTAVAWTVDNEGRGEQARLESNAARPDQIDARCVWKRWHWVTVVAAVVLVVVVAAAAAESIVGGDRSSTDTCSIS